MILFGESFFVNSFDISESKFRELQKKISRAIFLMPTCKHDHHANIKKNLLSCIFQVIFANRNQMSKKLFQPRCFNRVDGPNTRARALEFVEFSSNASRLHPKQRPIISVFSTSFFLKQKWGKLKTIMIIAIQDKDKQFLIARQQYHNKFTN